MRYNWGAREEVEKPMRLFALATIAAFGTVILGTGTTSVYAAPQTETNETAKNITIVPGDSLSIIADKNQSTAQRLYDANTKISDPNMIFPGDELRVPAKDEQLATRPFPVAASAPVAQPTETAQPVARQSPIQSASSAASGSVWDSLAACESGGNWAINTGNGYYGGLQFSQSSWNAVGGSGLPSNASRDEQIMRGQMLQARQGWGAWPACSAKLGLR